MPPPRKLHLQVIVVLADVVHRVRLDAVFAAVIWTDIVAAVVAGEVVVAARSLVVVRAPA